MNRQKFCCSMVTSTHFFYIVYSLTDRYNKFSEIQTLQLLLLFRATQFLELETRNSRKLIVLCQRSIFNAGISGFLLRFLSSGLSFFFSFFFSINNFWNRRNSEENQQTSIRSFFKKSGNVVISNFLMFPAQVDSDLRLKKPKKRIPRGS